MFCSEDSDSTDSELLDYLYETELYSCSDGSISSFHTTFDSDDSLQQLDQYERKPLNVHESVQHLLYALNSIETIEMKDILARFCRADVTVQFNCYANTWEIESYGVENQDTFSSLPPMSGLDSFVDYWMKVHETTPDCVITLKTPVRLCHRTKKGGSAYIFGVELVGTMLAWIDTPYPLTFQSNHFQPLSQQHMCLMGRRAVTSSIDKRGSVIMYVNEREQLIDRLDFYLEY
eukprot:gene19064-22424_t